MTTIKPIDKVLLQSLRGDSLTREVERKQEEVIYYLNSLLGGREDILPPKKIGIKGRSGIYKKCQSIYSDSCRGRIEGHHSDYSRPLQVEWLCTLHHERIHRNKNSPELLK